MRCEAVLKGLGERIARVNVKQGVSELYATRWYAEWIAICDDIKTGALSIEGGVRALGNKSREIRFERLFAETDR